MPPPLPEWARRLKAMVEGGAERCPTKTAYDSEQRARAFGSGYIRSGAPGVERMWPYPCGHCRRWHLTRRPRGDLAITATEPYEGASL